MFRYIALACEPAGAEEATVRHLVRNHLRPAGWKDVLELPGLRVFMQGDTRANAATMLHGRQGVILGRLFRRADLHHQDDKEPILSERESRHILGTDGQALVRDCWGRYIAFFPDRQGTPCVLRDPTGALPCFTLRFDGITIVFSRLKDALALLPTRSRPAISWDGVAAHLVLGDLNGRETALAGVTRVLPGERAPLPRGEPMILWHGHEHARPAGADPDQLRETVRSCVRHWAASYDTLLLRLSGGIDSSIVLACLAHAGMAARTVCVNYHSPGSDSDERPYARLAASRFEVELLELERDAEFALERTLDMALSPDPTRYMGRVSSHLDRQVALDRGATALFTGGGGDQLFYEFNTWWPASDHLRSQGLGAAFPAALLESARLARLSVWTTARKLLAERLWPTPLLGSLGSDLTLLRADAAAAVSRERFSHPELVLAADLPIGKRNQLWQLLRAPTYYDPLTQGSGPEVVYPLLSQPLVELCLSLPTYVLTQGGRPRGLVRKQFAADLPAEIAGRWSKGGMEEHVRSLLTRNLRFARELLLDGQLVGRGLLDRRKVELALTDRPSTQHSYMGEIHSCIGTEAWLHVWSRGDTAA